MVMRDRRAEQAAREAEIDAVIDDMSEKEMLFALYQSQLEATRYLKTCAAAASIFTVLAILSIVGWVLVAISSS